MKGRREKGNKRKKEEGELILGHWLGGGKSELRERGGRREGAVKYRHRKGDSKEGRRKRRNHVGTLDGRQLKGGENEGREEIELVNKKTGREAVRKGRGR